MKIQELFWVMFMVLVLVSCGTEFETNDDYLADIEIVTRGNGLQCLQACNDQLADCRDGNGQVGEGQADYYEYMQCRCPEGSTTTQMNDDCVWMGNNQNNPDGLDCAQLYQLWADYQDQCYVGYTVCVNACSSDNTKDDYNDKNTGPRGDCDGDGIPNGGDTTPGC